MSAFPASVRQRLGELTEGVSRNDLALRSASLTATYRAGQNSVRAVREMADALAYGLARMPATYAAVSRALEQLVQACPDISPSSLLDVGCGPGTAALAAVELFPDLEILTLTDRAGAFLDLAKQLTAQASESRLVHFTAADISAAQSFQRSDLVTCAYVLAELPEPVLEPLITALWEASLQALVLVEPGTPEGFRRLAIARKILIKAGATVAAPCTHEAACPMQGGDWCHFKVRVQRSRDHRLLKGAHVPFEDEPYAYLAVTRGKEIERKSHRVIKPPVLSKASIILPLCGPIGAVNAESRKRDGEKYKDFKRLDWGDEVEILIHDPLPESHV